MTESNRPRTILVIDDDLGFLMCLGVALIEAGLQVIPSGSVREALALLEELTLEVDLLIANALLLRESAELYGLLGRCARPARVLAIVAAGESAAPALPAGLLAAGVLQRPRDPLAPPPEDWLRAVRRALSDSTGEAA